MCVCVGVCQPTIPCMPGVAAFIGMLKLLGLHHRDSVGRVRDIHTSCISLNAISLIIIISQIQRVGAVNTLDS